MDYLKTDEHNGKEMTPCTLLNLMCRPFILYSIYECAPDTDNLHAYTQRVQLTCLAA